MGLDVDDMRRGVARALARFAPDDVVVGQFWAPLQHVLAAMRLEAWLVLRKGPDDWLVGPPSKDGSTHGSSRSSRSASALPAPSRKAKAHVRAHALIKGAA